MKYVSKFRVNGRGSFPVDMLRYDESRPDSEADSVKIAMTRDASGYDLDREVTLVTPHQNKAEQRRWEPTFQRWLSFGWRVSYLPDRIGDRWE